MDSIVKLTAMALALTVTAACTSDKPDYIDRMGMEHAGDAPVSNASTGLDPAAEVTAKNVDYATVDGNAVTGYLAKPKESEGGLPGLIVIHEWWGLNDNIEMMTRKLAGRGYTALAVDLYNGEVAESPDKAGNLARSVEKEKALENLRQAYDYLREEQNAGKIGTIGWCFGGGWSLNTALALPEKVDATVIYYGRLVTDSDELAKLEMPVLGIFGEEDQGIPPSTVKKFEEALNRAGVKNSIHIYEGANHAFANPSGRRYKEEAAEDAWAKTVTFLEKHLKGGQEAE